MFEAADARTLWAMHPTFLAGLLKSASIDAMLPEALKGLAGAFGAGGQLARAGAPADPIRDGATFILPLNGTITPKGSWGGTSSEKFADQVRAAATDDKVGVTIVAISSGGGMVWGGQEAADAVFEHRQVKPIVAVASPYSFSLAHWIGSQCSAYYASTSADVGSCGVRTGHVDTSGFEDKIGMKTTLIASDPAKIAAHPYAPLSDEDRAALQEEIAESNKAFVAAIARGRGLSVADVPKIHGTGQTYSAARATASGMIDGVMTLRDVIAKYNSNRTRLALMRRRAEAASAFLDI